MINGSPVLASPFSPLTWKVRVGAWLAVDPKMVLPGECASSAQHLQRVVQTNAINRTTVTTTAAGLYAYESSSLSAVALDMAEADAAALLASCLGSTSSKSSLFLDLLVLGTA